MSKSDLEKKLEDLWRGGDLKGAEKVAQDLLKLDQGNKIALQLLAKWTLSKGEFEAAAGYWKKLSEVSPPHWEIFIGWSQAAENAGNLEAAIKACKKGLKALKGDYLILFVLGQLSHKAGFEKQATTAFFHFVDIYSKLLLGADEAAKKQLGTHASQYEFARSHLERSLNGAYLKAVKETGAATNRVENAFYVRFSKGNISANILHKPNVFYLPGLADSPWAEPEIFPFIPDLVATFEPIKEEVLRNLRPDVDLTPTLRENQNLSPDLAPLAGSNNWGAYRFHEAFNKNPESQKRFPETWKVIESLPLYRIDGLVGDARISGIKAGVHIPPHFGFTNTTLNVHLPVVVPGEAGLKVAGQEASYKEGQPLIFDDSFIHEAWNKGDGTLLILSFEIWHPGLSNEEKQALAAGAKAENAWYKDRIFATLVED